MSESENVGENVRNYMQRMFHFIEAAANKYRIGKRYATKRPVEYMRAYTSHAAIAHNEMNAPLFVSCLLYHLFRKANLTSFMTTKNAYVYPAQVFTRLYGVVNKTNIVYYKETYFDVIAKEADILLTQPDLEYYCMVDNYLSCVYLSAIKATKQPTWRDDQFVGTVMSPIMKHLVAIAASILGQDSVAPLPEILKRQQVALLDKYFPEETNESETDKKENSVVKAEVPNEAVDTKQVDTITVEASKEPDEVNTKTYKYTPEQLIFLISQLAKEALERWDTEILPSMKEKKTPYKTLIETLNTEIQEKNNKKIETELTLKNIDNNIKQLKQIFELLS